MKDKFILGRYLPLDSVIHRLDPRAKFIFVFLFIILVFFAHSVATYLWLFLLIFSAMQLAKIRPWYIVKGLTPLWIFLALTFVMHLFLTKGGTRLIQVGMISIDSNGIIEGIYIVLRLMFIMMISTILTLSTSPLDLTHAFDKLLSPLKLVKVPVQQLSLMMSIALRFIPTLMEELDKIILAQKSRGSEISSGSLITRLRAFVPLLIPLFISAFQRAEDLAIAMEVRGYDVDRERTNYRRLHWKFKDTCFLLSIIPIALILFGLKYLGV
ncbi:energy-coupling factor transporter transmembrane component T family protein [Staphylococcus pettenkoferi]|uniref:energy-coupling factor transporter transmembrane component T family protein n=1 Tax=Staphylococcus pettenkoferi TaxID=170573 RepID=UPI00066A20F3|nr:energy-coupling factor transporter transmembrane component T [Staphylococcus pettenkoferi]MCI2803419.1 energy-coupling factor transporter transmembrane protein EcfT [Staphylococcus pettenkoferi]MCY1572998.1 energy-coupling factor transporter transmembrane protein EcfT [Staphylococcus pettenkoferi]MCY1579012.1 energy-coupling factor transporter transmembrane protein EcfT [Staphylococcus pettenkoferi]MCY1584594.1 energy-coupling factor transporter transmembrane protein EcfT [Staphylococcus pet